MPLALPLSGYVRFVGLPDLGSIGLLQELYAGNRLCLEFWGRRALSGLAR